MIPGVKVKNVKNIISVSTQILGLVGFFKKSRRPEGPKGGPKGHRLEVGARRAPKLLVLYKRCALWKMRIYNITKFPWQCKVTKTVWRPGHEWSTSSAPSSPFNIRIFHWIPHIYLFYPQPNMRFEWIALSVGWKRLKNSQTNIEDISDKSSFQFSRISHHLLWPGHSDKSKVN